MPITAPIPLPGQPMEGFWQGATNTQNILSKILEGRQNQQNLEQQKIANEQLNKYRMGSLAQQGTANEQLNKYRMGELGLGQAELPSKIALHEAQADYYNMGGAGGGVDLKNQLGLMKQAMMDNPGSDMNKANQITSAWLNNSPTLPDGTPTPKPSGNAEALIDNINKRRTTAAQINQTLNAVGGEAEINKLTSIAKDWNKPYGTTYMNMSPDQIIDTFKSDAKSQDRLGDFIAAQQLQFDIAQMQNRIAMTGHSGITNTQELMHRSMQNINARYPRLSQKARERAQKQFTWALKEALKERNKVGISASTAFNAGKNEGTNTGTNTPKATLRYNQKTGEFEEI